MSESPNLAKLSFQVIHVVQGDDLPDLSVVMLVGKDLEGKLRLWVDDYSTYYTEHKNLEVRAALKAMTGRSTSFYEAPDFIRAEWIEDGDTWIPSRGNTGIEL